MGGTVTVVIRESNGTEHRMQRWTNSMSWGICNAKMINEDPAHIKEYIKQWQSMSDDWENNQPGPFEFPMTDAYFPSVGFAPVSYGFVLIDFKTKHLLSAQGYTTFDRVLGTAVGLEHGKYGQALTGDDETETQRLINLIKAGRVTTYEVWRDDDLVSLPLPSELIENPLSSAIGKFLDDKERRFCQFNVDWSPFTIIDYEFNKEGLDIRDAYAKVKELGFAFNADEDKIWQEWAKEAERDSDDE